MAFSYREKFGALDDDAWLDVLLRSVEDGVVDGVAMPGFPPAELQEQIVGGSNVATLREADRFYRLLKQTYAALRGPFVPETRILDFGVGWGRYARFFLKDVEPENIHGVDVVQAMLDTLVAARVPGSFALIEPKGKLPHTAGFFDIAFAYSVFSHLPEPVHLHWLVEIARVMKPGGIVVLTTQPRRFLEFVLTLPGQPETGLSAWHRQLRAGVQRVRDPLDAYDRGDFVYLPSGGGEALAEEIYGDAMVPPLYIAGRWNEWFDLVEYLDNHRHFAQSIVTLRRKEPAR